MVRYKDYMLAIINNVKNVPIRIIKRRYNNKQKSMTYDQDYDPTSITYKSVSIITFRYHQDNNKLINNNN